MADDAHECNRRFAGMVDHALVGHLVGYKANAAIGVSWQIFLVVIVFISSLFTGMSVLVARFAGAGDEEKVNRTVYQAFLTALFIALGIMAPVGYLLSPSLLNLVHAAPNVKAEALPFLRIMFVCSIGMMIFFMLSGALRSAGDARTPMVLGITMTVLNLVLNIVLIRGLGPIPAFGTKGAAMGTCIASGAIALYALGKLWSGDWVVSLPRGHFRPDWGIIKAIFRFGLPTGIQGIAMNIGGVFMLAFIGSLARSAAAQAAFAVSYTELFSLVTWTSVGLMGAAAAVAGQNLGAGQPDRADAAVHVAARFGFAAAAVVSGVWHGRTDRRCDWRAAFARAQHIGVVHCGGVDVHRRITGYRRYAQPALHLDRFADRRPAQYLLCRPANEHARSHRHLDRDSRRTRDALFFERNAV